jgi:hypothetical protein
MVAAVEDAIERALLGEVHMFGQQAIPDPEAVWIWASRKGARRAGMQWPQASSSFAAAGRQSRCRHALRHEQAAHASAIDAKRRHVPAARHGVLRTRKYAQTDQMHGPRAGAELVPRGCPLTGWLSRVGHSNRTVLAVACI